MIFVFSLVLFLLVSLPVSLELAYGCLAGYVYFFAIRERGGLWGLVWLGIWFDLLTVRLLGMSSLVLVVGGLLNQVVKQKLDSDWSRLVVGLASAGALLVIHYGWGDVFGFLRLVIFGSLVSGGVKFAKGLRSYDRIRVKKNM